MAAISWAWREAGVQPRHLPPHERALREAAEDVFLSKKSFDERQCEVPGVPRSTFLMAFSPDGTKVASTHGNHDVYVSELATGRHVRTLSGHPRTPWCVAFHPSHARLLASGCLGGQVRVWDLSGGSEVWTVATESVVASVAFHPRDRLLVIAAYDEIHFWDWSRPRPFASVKTDSVKAKVRFVAFDALGHKLVTGVSCWPCALADNSPSAPAQPAPLIPNTSQTPSRDQIVSSYRHLVQRYNALVRNYHYVTAGRPQPINTTDRGTDPMETDDPRPGTSEDGSASSSRTAMRNQLAASLNRLQGFMENSIDRTLSLWERYAPEGNSGEVDVGSEAQRLEALCMLRNSGNRLLNIIANIRNSGRERNGPPGNGSANPSDGVYEFYENIYNVVDRNEESAVGDVAPVATFSRDFSNVTEPVASASSAPSAPSAPPAPSAYDPFPTRNDDALDRVTRGVRTIERHTQALLDLSTSCVYPSLRRVRAMWEELRREIICLQRSGENETGNYFSLSSLERCRLVDPRRPSRSAPSPAGPRIRSPVDDVSVNSSTATTRLPTENLSSRLHLPETSSGSYLSMNFPYRLPAGDASSGSNSFGNLSSRIRVPGYLSSRAHLFGDRNVPGSQPGRGQTSWTQSDAAAADTADADPRSNSRERALNSQLDTMIWRTVRSLNNLQTWLERSDLMFTAENTSPPVNSDQRPHGSNAEPASAESRPSIRVQLSIRRGRNRRPSSRLGSVGPQEIGHRRNATDVRRGELEITRDRIRMRARRVLAIMFNIMMDCLESDQLSNRIIAMLRSLKKALSITSILLFTHLFSDEPDPNRPRENSTSVTDERNPRPRPRPNPTMDRINDQVFANLSRPRTQSRPHPASRTRRRMPVPLSRIRSLFSNLQRAARETAAERPRPSTSGLQRWNSSEPADSAPAGRSPDVENPRTPPEAGGPTRSHLYRSVFYNQRLMGNMLHVLRRSEVSDRQNLPESDPPHPDYFYLRRLFSFRDDNAPNDSPDQNSANQNAAPVPVVRVNDVPVNEIPIVPEYAPNNHVFVRDYLPMNVLAMEDNDNRWPTTFRFITECPSSPVHRIQVWDFTKGELPDLSDVNKNIVVRKCKIHNDASIDISRDGRLLVALLPAQRMGIFSLEWHNLGECLYTILLEQNAVSVSLSPCTRHLAVGLGSRRVSLLPIGRNGVMATIYRLGDDKMREKDIRLGNLIPVKSLEQNWDSGFTSLNCLRWAPQPGQGLVYADNTGQLKILS